MAGCEYGDLERLVSQNGVEGTLRILYRRGVYLTVDEFKGRRPAKRGSATIPITPERLRNPLTTVHVLARSSGSRSAGTPVSFDLAFIRTCAVNACLSFEARGGGGWLKADWEILTVGGTFRILKLASFGRMPVRWFCQTPPAGGRYRLGGPRAYLEKPAGRETDSPAGARPR